MHERIKYQAALYRIGGQEEKIDICQTAGDCVPSAIALEKPKIPP